MEPLRQDLDTAFWDSGLIQDLGPLVSRLECRPRISGGWPPRRVRALGSPDASVGRELKRILKLYFYGSASFNLWMLRGYIFTMKKRATYWTTPLPCSKNRTWTQDSWTFKALLSWPCMWSWVRIPPNSFEFESSFLVYLDWLTLQISDKSWHCY